MWLSKIYDNIKIKNLFTVVRIGRLAGRTQRLWGRCPRRSSTASWRWAAPGPWPRSSGSCVAGTPTPTHFSFLWAWRKLDPRRSVCLTRSRWGGLDFCNLHSVYEKNMFVCQSNSLRMAKSKWDKFSQSNMPKKILYQRNHVFEKILPIEFFAWYLMCCIYVIPMYFTL